MNKVKGGMPVVLDLTMVLILFFGRCGEEGCTVAGTTFVVLVNRTGRRGENKTTSLSTGPRKFMSRCEGKN